MENIQNYFVQITIIKGKIIENEDGTTTKEIVDTVKDNVECFPTEEEVNLRIKEMIDG